MNRNNGAQFSPCVIAKVRDAFAGAQNYNRNNKKCSRLYWDEACEILGNSLNKTVTDIDCVKSQYQLYNV